MRYKNILLVDDDVDIQELVGFFLRQAGFVVQTARDGFTALTELQSNYYDLVILDISMPHINGFKVLKKMREMPKFKNLPVIMLTASQAKSDEERVQDEVSDYLIKPPNRDDLLKRIERILGGRPQFEEIQFAENDPAAQGAVTIHLRLVSISHHGLMLLGTVPVDKNVLIQPSQIGLFRELKLRQEHFKIMECTPKGDGTYEYFISFLGMHPDDQDIIHRWLMKKVFGEKKIAA